MSRVLQSPGPHHAFPCPPAFPLWSGVFLVSARSLSEFGGLTALLCPRPRHGSEAVDVDRGQLVYPSLKDVAVIVDLYEFAPVGGRATSWRDRWRFEWFVQVREGPTSRGLSHPGLLPLANLRFDVSRLLPAVSSEPDVAATRWALERKPLAHPGHEFRPRNPGCVVRPGLRPSVAVAFRGAGIARMFAGSGMAPLTNVPNGDRRDGPPELVVRGKYPVVAMPVLPRRRHGIRQTIEELNRRTFDDAIGSRPRGLPPATPPDPVGRLVSGEHVADADDAAVGIADNRSSAKGGRVQYRSRCSRL